MLAQVHESFSIDFSALISCPLFYRKNLGAWHTQNLKRWWVRPDLNQRPRHLQCRALPTKLLTRASLARLLAISSLPMGQRGNQHQSRGALVHSAPWSVSVWKVKRVSNPLSAPWSNALNSSAENVDSSPVPWTSTYRPSLVLMTFMSTSAFESRT